METSLQFELRSHDEVTLKLSFLDSAVRVTLLSAETNGIWIRAEDLHDTLPGSGGPATDGKPAVSELPGESAVFVPFARVQYVVLAAQQC